VTQVFDASGRFSPAYDDDDVVTIPADGCVLAVGQRADLSFLRPEDGVELTPGGTVKIDRATLATSAPGVFAGGDVAFGPRNLIEAIANGKRAARSIHEHLSGETARLESVLTVEKIPTRDYRMIAGFELLDRAAPPTIDLGRRSGIAEVEAIFPDDEAIAQGARCLVCHVQTIYDPEKCVLCGRCVDVCPEYCLALVPLEDVSLPAAEREALVAAAAWDGLPLSAMLKDDTRCIRCGLCAIRCPTDAMTMERFQITERWAPAP
jgi:formate dehydrogenase beta subunit